MAPIKFEEHIKEKLDGREIKPSANAWGKISGQITSSQEKKSKGFAWYAVAACLIGLLIASFIIFIETESNINLPETSIVNENKEKRKELEAPIEQFVLPPVANKSKDDPLNAIVLEDKKEIEVLKNKEQNSKSTVVTSNSGIAKTVLKDDSVIKGVNENVFDKDEIIKLKIKDLVAQVNALESNNSVVSDTEIDELLRKAEREILANKIFKDTSNKVDAMALLDEAENELDKSLRDHLFDTLKEGFFKVRTAVADRNN
ncbi:hypothetical protein H0I23_00620 [Cellulophaga sp. HaHaR_3_176]|uniref:hypothetical protein n=1 Tax=Cellulophaga sp. HaHaR_3_176 TaxID=1942464 RepID=UPI001C1F4166|nr:hypothetical protein [Cellulophaga sp. HaHaR_3_176]QWX84187.1 hypothetical protein H0I23_00620 [Cellulophaga sp. HaHaR_3_176]